jgi:hypothetical protein
MPRFCQEPHDHESRIITPLFLTSARAQFDEFIAVLQESNSATVLATGGTAPMPTSGVANVVQRVR